jgi:putative endonuclease
MSGPDRLTCVAPVALPPHGPLGRAGEDAASLHLCVVHGLDLVARNWRVELDGLRGELDLVVRDPRSATLVVCEVKTRTHAQARDGALATLGPRQQARIRRLTAVLLTSGGIRASRVRFDLVAVDLPSAARSRGVTLTHLADAW